MSITTPAIRSIIKTAFLEGNIRGPKAFASTRPLIRASAYSLGDDFIYAQGTKSGIPWHLLGIRGVRGQELQIKKIKPMSYPKSYDETDDDCTLLSWPGYQSEETKPKRSAVNFPPRLIHADGPISILPTNYENGWLNKLMITGAPKSLNIIGGTLFNLNGAEDKLSIDEFQSVFGDWVKAGAYCMAPIEPFHQEQI